MSVEGQSGKDIVVWDTHDGLGNFESRDMLTHSDGRTLILERDELFELLEWAREQKRGMGK